MKVSLQQQFSEMFFEIPKKFSTTLLPLESYLLNKDSRTMWQTYPCLWGIINQGSKGYHLSLNM
jgi:hypothetical protein